MILDKRWRHKWKVGRHWGRLVIWYQITDDKSVVSKQYYHMTFDEKEMNMLRWLMKETTNHKPKRSTSIKEIQHKLGDIVWNKLGERTDSN